MAHTTGIAEVNGTTIRYQLDGSGPVVVFVHGFTADLRLWEPQMKDFTERFQVLRYDLRGHGKSGVPTDEPYSHEDDLKALLDSLGIERAVVIGLSLGARVVIDFALTHAKMVRALVPVDGGPSGHEVTEEDSDIADQILSALETDGPEAAMQVWLASPVFAGVRRDPEQAARLAEMIRDYPGWDGLAADPARTLDPPAVTRLGEIQVRTLVVVGEEDLKSVRASADLLHREIPGARKVVLPGVGHISNLEDPESFNAVVLEFLEELPD